MRKRLIKFMPLCIIFTLLTWGCAQNKTTPPDSAMKPAAQKQRPNVYKGQIVGKSNKDKTISIVVSKGDKLQTMMVKFDGKTKGMEHAAKGHSAIITWKIRNGDKVATAIKPKLAKLPERITEIKSKKVKSLLDKQTDFILIDARPTDRYTRGHLPTAISITAKQMSGKGLELLPKEKNKLLVFYGGGPK